MDRGEPQLVFGDDGSAHADVVWSWINNHAWPGWRILVVTAQPPSWGSPAGTNDSSLHPWTPPGPRRLYQVEQSDAVEHLTAEADPRDVLGSFPGASLVAIGPRGAGVVKHLHIGSTAEWLVSGHGVHAPLVIVRSARPTRHVLLCVDGSEHGHQATRSLAGMPWIGDCRITILGVVTERDDRAEGGVARATAFLRDQGVEQVTEEVTASVDQTAGFDVRSTILGTIDNEKPDLVVVGTRGQGRIRRLVLGSTSSAVVHHATCSVLVARHPESADAQP